MGRDCVYFLSGYNFCEGGYLYVVSGKMDVSRKNRCKSKAILSQRRIGRCDRLGKDLVVCVVLSLPRDLIF